MASGSSTSAEVVPGFTLVRALGRRTWEATQLGLGRRVALRRLDPGTAFAAVQWPERPGVVPLYAVVETSAGTYVATRLVPGARTLAECGGARRRWLAAAEAALDGTVHGALTDHDVLIDPAGGVHLTGFGRAAPGATAADDRAALAGLRLAAPRRRNAWPIAAACVLLAGVAAVALVTRGSAPPAPPPVPGGAVPVGSALTAGALRSVDCDGQPPSGASPLCTVFQAALPGRRLETRRAGLVRGWAVRGARGRIALIILRPSGRGYVQYHHSRIVEVRDPGRPTYFRAKRSAPAGARFGVELSPGAAVGIRGGVAGAATARVYGPLRSAPARVPVTRGGGGEELLLRVDVAPRPG